ncbi:TetR/AcrR family transcriptional regulator [Mycolicibacterium porcinum]|uniref:TetR/AcrR family transcriptional regulator n=1 Tax=Mycolicibacterium porcinum TaxID=39693 RepID=UPI0008488A44|nr:TetR family transcriptional regulator [Mycolicibacterium porcinum]ODR17764.1 hypothetical protein BHQ19_28210 [Mycolicibacterium porcinum]
MPVTGLREQKKAATRAAISAATLQLTTSSGFAAVSVEDIAAAANVSTRTFHNYFPSREAALLAVLEDVERFQSDAFLARDAHEPVLDSLEAAALALVGHATFLDNTVRVTRLIIANPGLIAHATAVAHQAAADLLAEIGRRTGTDPDVDLFPRLAYNASQSVTGSVVELIVGGQPLPAPPVTLVHRGFDQLRKGISQPQGSGITRAR